jgi:hypothetical protein
MWDADSPCEIKKLLLGYLDETTSLANYFKGNLLRISQGKSASLPRALLIYTIHMD